jgi:hypothetical protein
MTPGHVLCTASFLLLGLFCLAACKSAEHHYTEIDDIDMATKKEAVHTSMLEMLSNADV